ncbi:hypothetical protein K7G98_06120 [Saccharothrix sp. MB29]|nr:hypothetical protein [Saccharothrix sp. MB29]
MVGYTGRAMSAIPATLGAGAPGSPGIGRELDVPAQPDDGAVPSDTGGAVGANRSSAFRTAFARRAGAPGSRTSSWSSTWTSRPGAR